MIIRPLATGRERSFASMRHGDVSVAQIPRSMCVNREHVLVCVICGHKNVLYVCACLGVFVYTMQGQLTCNSAV